ncbi:MAG: c-type cytochrome [Halioglobus sp.]
MEFGLWDDVVADPGYGRNLVTGRGHAPWVMRTNLDGQYRMLSFALAPDLWLAYQTESASLYQLWRGEILFEGAVYDYRHGPQPTATGEWLLRQEPPSRWEITVAEQSRPATVQYLGHYYGENQSTAGLSYELKADGFTATIREEPEIVVDEGITRLVRQFSLSSETDGLSVTLHQENIAPTLLPQGETVLSIPLDGPSTAIPDPINTASNATEGELDSGRQIIQNSDCLGCHSESQEVVGPSFARVAKRYGGHAQEAPVTALIASILQGSDKKWGQVAMPGHPEMSAEDARSAVLYILTLSALEAEQDIPLQANGEPYVSTTDYSVGERLMTVHPAFELNSLTPAGFEPKVGGMAFRSDGNLLVSSWDRDGGVFLVDPQAPAKTRVRRIAEGLHEPLGLTVVEDRIFVLQKQEITELVDHDGDDIIDEYRTIANSWPTSANFHSFAFGLVHREGYLYGLFSICVQPGGATCPEQQPSQGKTFQISLATGETEYFATGFRTPNGIALGPDDELFVTDNQGDWLPASKLLHVEQGKFYGVRFVLDKDNADAVETPPVVWLPQNEIGNSPTQPIVLNEGPYSGQLIFGDVYHGGIKRVYMERIAGALQGAVFRFSAGFQGGVNRIVRGPNNALYLGEIGNPPNWGEVNKAWHGLEKLSYKGKPAYEILRINATSSGFNLTLSEPLDKGLEPKASDLVARQWFYYPTEQYGGPKYDETQLTVSSLQLSGDRRTLHAEVPGLKAGYVVYMALDRRLLSASGAQLWSYEAWYTLNAVPGT